MTRSELPNNSLKTDSLTPNAPFHYVVAGSQGIMLAAATMLLLYIIIVVVGLICGLGWGSSVSYTHLDVYKRQKLYSPTNSPISN